MTVRLHPRAAELRRLAAVARGREEASLIVTGGALVNVFTEEVIGGWGLAVAAGIAGVRALLAAAESMAGRLLCTASGLIVLDPVVDARLDMEDWPALLD